MSKKKNRTQKQIIKLKHDMNFLTNELVNLTEKINTLQFDNKGSFCKLIHDSNNGDTKKYTTKNTVTQLLEKIFNILCVILHYIFSIVVLKLFLCILLFVTPCLVKLNMYYINFKKLKVIDHISIEVFDPSSNTIIYKTIDKLNLPSIFNVSVRISLLLIFLSTLILWILKKLRFDKNDLYKDFKKAFEYIVAIFLFYLFFIDDSSIILPMKAIISLELIIIKMFFDPSNIRTIIINKFMYLFRKYIKVNR